jgi:hypothetical protein
MTRQRARLRIARESDKKQKIVMHAAERLRRCERARHEPREQSLFLRFRDGPKEMAHA